MSQATTVLHRYMSYRSLIRAMFYKSNPVKKQTMTKIENIRNFCTMHRRCMWMKRDHDGQLYCAWTVKTGKPKLMLTKPVKKCDNKQYYAS